MIKRIIVFASLLVCAEWVGAADEHLVALRVGSETYSNVTVTMVTATDLYFTHSRGFGNAKLKNLDPDVQKLFHYDPAKAADKEKLQTDAQALYAKALRDTKPATPQKPLAGAETDTKAAQSPGSEVIPPHPIYARSFLNRPAPEIVVQKWLTEEPDMAGKFILVDFWATWCGPCRQSIPGLNALYKRFKDRLVIIGLTDESEAVVRRMTNPRIDYFVGTDPERHSKATVAVTGIPHALLIDPKGIVRFEGMPHYLDERSLAKLMAKYGD